MLYGIIDCKIESCRQLMPFTDKLSIVINMIHDRKREQQDNEKYRWYGQGWDYDNKFFNGYMLESKFLRYPPHIKGFTLKYLYKFYPSQLKYLSDNELILIPNRFLDTLGNNELVREIRLNQERHLFYSDICSTSDTIKSSEYNGIVSSYQGKTISQIIYSKGGTKHLVGLLKFGNLNIDKSVLEKLFTNAATYIEKNCYNILLSVIKDIEYKKEQYNDWVQRQWDEYDIKEANREFNDMMHDYDAWGNLD